MTILFKDTIQKAVESPRVKVSGVWREGYVYAKNDGVWHLIHDIHGTTWSTSPAISDNGYLGSISGEENNALTSGGATSDVTGVKTVHRYNGTIWAEAGPRLPEVKVKHTSFGIATAMIIAGGSVWGGVSGALPGQSCYTGAYNTSWATTTYLNISRHSGGSFGLSALGFVVAGDSTQTCERWSGSVWSTTASIPHVAPQISACGYHDSAIAFGGATGAPYTQTLVWNGSVWSTTVGLNNAIYGKWTGGCGQRWAALAFLDSVTERWTGNSWSTTTTRTSGFLSSLEHRNNSGTTSGTICGGQAIALGYTSPGSKWS